MGRIIEEIRNGQEQLREKILRAVVTDSCCSIDPQTALRWGVMVVRQKINWPDKTTSSDFEMPSSEFYKKMKRDGVPKTSGAPAGEFEQVYESFYGQGIREIVSLHVSGGESGTFNFARQGAVLAAEKYPDLKIKVINTRSLSLGQWFLVAEAKNLADMGDSLDSIETKILAAIPNNIIGISLSNIGNAVLGGRLPGVVDLVNSAMHISAQIRLDEDGKVVQSGKVRGEKKGLIAIADSIKREADRRKILPTRLGVVYTKDKDIGHELVGKLSGYWGRQDVICYGPTEAGAVLGVHAGERACGVAAFWGKN